MKIFHAGRFLVFLTFAFLLAGCVGGDSTNKKAANAAQNSNVKTNASQTKDDPGEFDKIVSLPFVPEEVTWREVDTQNGKKLIAVLKFSPQDSQAIATNAEKYRPALAAELDAEDWFPPELIAQSQESGDGILKGKNYAANDFISRSYVTGKLTRINDTNYFVLELTN